MPISKIARNVVARHLCGAALSLEDQLKLIQANPPKLTKDGKLWALEIFSPVVKKYIPMSERATQEEAKEDLEFWELDHKRVIKNLRDAIKAPA